MDTLATLRFALFPTARVGAPAVSFDDVVTGFQEEVFGVALRMLGDRDAAGDVTGRVFLKAYRSFHRYEAGRPLRNWLLTIAVREAITEGRRIGRERAHRDPDAETLTIAGPAVDEPEARAVEREERARIRAAVAALPELYRVPIVLRYFNDLSLEEIAGITGRPASTVGVQLLRGRAMLRERLGGNA